MSTKQFTYEELATRRDALDAQINGTAPVSAPVQNLLATDAYREAFSGFLRSGQAANSLAAGHNGSGGYLVPESMEKRLVSGLEEANILRKIATVKNYENDVRIPVQEKTGAADWVSENDPVPEDDMSFTQIRLGAHKMAAFTKVIEEMLQDGGFNLESFITDGFAQRLGDREEYDFLHGDGKGKPLGLLRTASVGAVTETAGTVTPDDMLELYHSLRGCYRPNAVWVFHDSVIPKLVKARLGLGPFLWQEDPGGQGYDMFMGHKVFTCKSMPSLNNVEFVPGSSVALFGDFSHYLIADRGRPAFKRMDELFTLTGQVGFKLTRRVDAVLTLPEAVQSLQMKLPD